jgi:hypothetical protein
MNLHWKQLLVAMLAVLAGLALATPLLISHIVPAIITVQGPKADLSLDPVFASFTVQHTNSDIALPDWYNRNSYGDPSQISYNVVLNVTNNSNETAIVDLLYISAGPTYTPGSVTWTPPKSTIERTIEGVYLDGKWVNTTWIPSNQSIVGGGYWRQGVDVQSVYTNGNLTQTFMRIDGQWVDVTERVTVPGQELSIPNDQITMLGPFMSETLSFTPGNSSVSQIDSYASVQVNSGKDGFNNFWAPNQSRLIMLNGTVFATARNIADLKLTPTYLHLQVSAMLQQSYANTDPARFIDTSSLRNQLCQIQLTPVNNSYEYNKALTANQTFQPDQFGVEAFIENRS